MGWDGYVRALQEKMLGEMYHDWRMVLHPLVVAS